MDVLILRLHRCPTEFSSSAFQKLDYDVIDLNRLQDGVDAERTALIVLHTVSRGQILGRGHVAEGVRFDRITHQEERGDECHFAAEDAGEKAVG